MYAGPGIGTTLQCFHTDDHTSYMHWRSVAAGYLVTPTPEPLEFHMHSRYMHLDYSRHNPCTLNPGECSVLNPMSLCTLGIISKIPVLPPQQAVCPSNADAFWDLIVCVDLVPLSSLLYRLHISLRLIHEVE